jgi:hypothetical protein
MYVCMHACMYVYDMYSRVRAYTHACVRPGSFIIISFFKRRSMLIHLRTHARTHTHTHAHTHTHTHTHTHIYTHTQTHVCIRPAYFIFISLFKRCSMLIFIEVRHTFKNHLEIHDIFKCGIHTLTNLSLYTYVCVYIYIYTFTYITILKSITSSRAAFTPRQI